MVGVFVSCVSVSVCIRVHVVCWEYCAFESVTYVLCTRECMCMMCVEEEAAWEVMEMAAGAGAGVRKKGIRGKERKSGQDRMRRRRSARGALLQWRVWWRMNRERRKFTYLSFP